MVTCLDEANSGRVLDIDVQKKSKRALTFLNSSVRQFVTFLTLFEHAVRLDGQGGPDRLVLIVVRQALERMQSIDPPAFEDGQTWWLQAMRAYRYEVG